jgi:hypothetical protein
MLTLKPARLGQPDDYEVFDEKRKSIERDELAGLKRLQRDQEPKSSYVFVNERGQPFGRMLPKVTEVAFCIGCLGRSAKRRAFLGEPERWCTRSANKPDGLFL